MTNSKKGSNSDLIQISPEKTSSFIHPTSKYLSLEVPLTRAGIFLYEDPAYPGGFRRDYRPVEEVLDEASLRTISGGGLPLVRLHPSVGVVTTENFEGLDLVGNISDQISYAAVESTDEGEEGDLVTDGIVRGRITIYSQEAIDEYQKGQMKSLSLGYNCDRYFTPGVLPNGEAYDAIQRNIIYNHGSTVPLGRYGVQNLDEKIRKLSESSTHDGIGFEQLSEFAKIKTTKIFILPKMTKTTETSTATVDQLTGANKALTDQIDALNSQIATLTGERDAALKQVSEAEAEEITPSQVLGLVQDALTLVKAAELSGVAKEGEDLLSAAVNDSAELVTRVMAKVAPKQASQSPDVSMGYLTVMLDSGALIALFNKDESRPVVEGDSATIVKESDVAKTGAKTAAKSNKTGEAPANRYRSMWLKSKATA
jgi:hypothetical protein